MNQLISSKKQKSNKPAQGVVDFMDDEAEQGNDLQPPPQLQKKRHSDHKREMLREQHEVPTPQRSYQARKPVASTQSADDIHRMVIEEKEQTLKMLPAVSLYYR
jgi:hypothetical protein